MSGLKDSSVATRLPASDLARAREFYADKLGLEPSEERPGGLLYHCAGGEVLEMTYFHKLTAEEIADQLGISVDNVYARRSRGGKELEKILRDLES